MYYVGNVSLEERGCGLGVCVEFRVGEREALKGPRVDGCDDISIHWTKTTRLVSELRIKVVVTLFAFLQRNENHRGS